MQTSKFLAFAFTSALIGGVAVAKPVTKPQAPAVDSDADTMSITMSTSKGRLGVAVVQISPELRSHLGAPADRGVLVDAVKAESPAAKAGLRVGDVITEVDGDAATSAMDMLQAMTDRKQGDSVPLVVMRAGTKTPLTATLADEPGPVWSQRQLRSGFSPDPRFQQWFDASGMSSMDAFTNRGADEGMQKRIDELERRLKKLEKSFH